MKLTKNEMYELACLYGDLLALLDDYKHLEDTQKWKAMKARTEKEYQALNDKLDILDNQ